MKTSMREMARRKAERKAGTPEGTRNPNIISPFQQRAKAKTWNDDKQVEPELVVVPEDLEKLAVSQTVPHDGVAKAAGTDRDGFARRYGMRPLKPPPCNIPERNDAARVAARRDRNGIA